MEVVVEKTNCRVCCEDTNSEFILEWRGFQLRKCQKCGVIFSDTRIKKEYVFEASKGHAPSMFCDDLLGKKKEHDRIKEAHWQLDLIEEFVKPGKIFDVGAAGGTFLSIARARKWKIYGNEVSETCIRIAKQVYDINLHKGFLEDEIADGSYNAIVMWNVLEHLYEPLDALQHIKKMLVPGGVILTKLPMHTAETIQTEHMLPDHLFNFSENSLDFLLNKVGLHRVENVSGSDGSLPTLVTVIK